MKNKIQILLQASLYKFIHCNLSCYILIAIFSITLKVNAQTFPSGFSQIQISTIYFPTCMAFAPDGRIFVCEKAGKVKIIKNGVVLSTPFLTVTVDQLNERGLSSICLDPNFSTNHYLYIYYTSTSGSIHNRLSRFTANGDVVSSGSEVIILEFEPSVNSIHNSGGMAFAPDGKLFLAVGNDNVNTNSQDLNNYKGKILRINPDGSVPSGNPFTGSESAKRIWAYGLRNPWTISFQPGTNKLFVNDVGEGSWEEINDATVAGRNFGWPATQGATTNPAYTTPLYTYHHGTPGTDLGCAITGGAFFNPPSSNYPAIYTGKYFFIDYCNSWINYLDLSSGVTRHDFATGLASSNNYIKVGTDGNLYYFSIGQRSIYKIIYSNNNVPVVTTQPQDESVPQGQNASFSVTASGSTPLSYQWKKNGVNITGANSSNYTITNAQPAQAGQYSVNVSNAFGNVMSNSATLSVTAFNAKPVATILNPPSGTFYRSGEMINFNGNGTDNEDGTLPASAFYWYIEFHHDLHYHPGPTIPAGVKSGSFSTAFGEPSANIFFRLFLVVTDAGGLTDTAFVDIHPITSNLTLATQPTGLQIILDGQPHVCPFSMLTISGMTRGLDVTTPQTLGGSIYAFDHWSQGGAASQNISITDFDSTYTAVFTATGPSTLCSATGTISRDFWANMTGTSVASVPVNTTPTSTELLTLFEGPSNVADYYGSRIRGYICPPATGNYIFWIASDNGSELWLSTNSTTEGKVKIASVPSFTSYHEWLKYPSQQSIAIYLTEGVKYYIEAIHREGTQGDNLSVGWQLPNGILERPIPGSRLSPFTTGTTAPTVSITSPGNGTTFGTPANIVITANAATSNGTIDKVEFFEGTTKIGEDLTYPYSFTWMNATAGNYALNAMATDNNGLMGMSENVNITVTSCSTASITPAGPTTMCSGSVLLKANTGAGMIYQWKKDGANISGATSSTFNAAVSGDYQVKVIQGSCISWSSPIKVRIQSGLSASITPGGPTTFCNGGNVKLYANTCSGYTYQWKKNNVDIVGATAATYTANSSGNYQIKVTQAAVSAWSSLLAVTVNSCEGSGEIPNDESNSPLTISEPSNPTGDFQMKVFPNPNNGLFTIIVNTPTLKEEKIKLKIVNLLGQVVYNKEFIANSDYFKETVELDSSLKTGVYTLQLMIGNKIENTSIILSK